MNWQWIATNWPKIADLALTHVQIALPPIAVAFLVALPVGWVAHRHARVRDVLVGAASLLYVVPSLALFVALPLVLGTSVLSPVNVVVALSLYGIALQVRSTADAFDTVPTSTREAATAVGYTARHRFWAVDLPLAAPMILSGLRVVAASTISLTSVGALIGVRSLGTLFTEGFQRSFPTEIVTGLVSTLLIALLVDVALRALGYVALPWTRRRA